MTAASVAFASTFARAHGATLRLTTAAATSFRSLPTSMGLTRPRRRCGLLKCWGSTPMSNDPFRPIGGAGTASKKDSEWTPLLPAPDDAPPPPALHPKLGQPAETYTYRAADGKVNGYVMRFNHAGGKEFRPLTFCRHPGGIFRDWRWTTWRKPRPLFGLDKLHTRRAALVLVVEGEKACQAAERLAPGYVCITSPGGSKAAAQADWTPLNG